MNDATLCITHSADLDGLCSQAIARKALGDRATYLGWDYGQPVPDLSPYTTVYLIDISLPHEVMAANAAKLIWIDHHRTAIDDMRDLEIAGYRIDGVAACRLAWQWFFGVAQLNGTPAELKATYVERQVTEPYAVQLLGRYDVWDRAGDENVDLFQLGMQAESAPDWESLFSEVQVISVDDKRSHPPPQVATIIDRGRAIHSYTTVTSAQIVTERGFDVTWEGLRFRALNIARCNSMTFLAALTPEHDACLAYFWNGRGWRFSLYHAPGKEHHNLSLIAKRHGGGGHPGACGFELARLPVEFGGPEHPLIQLSIADTPPNRALLRRALDGDELILSHYRLFMAPIVDAALEAARGDSRLSEEAEVS